MSIVTGDSATNRLQDVTNALDYNSAYTVTFWVQFNSVTGWRLPYVLDDGNATSSFDIFGQDSGNTWTILVDGTQATGTGGPSINTWYGVVLTRTNTTTLICRIYDTSLSQITAFSRTQSISGRAAVSDEMLGSWPNDNGHFTVCNFKSWSAALSEAQAIVELGSVRPQVLASLYRWSPIFNTDTERTKDYSGNGRAWSVNGTLTNADNAPVSWGASTFIASLAAAGGGGGGGNIASLLCLQGVG